METVEDIVAQEPSLHRCTLLLFCLSHAQQSKEISEADPFSSQWLTHHSHCPESILGSFVAPEPCTAMINGRRFG
jgi:hypothetical protein